jgi:hypothetical protein
MLTIPQISATEFMVRLKKRRWENTELIGTIETFLKQKRGYVFKMPKPGMPVVMIVSGGLDSVVSLALLLEKYKLHVYPLYLDTRGRRSKKEAESVRLFVSIFRKRYPGLIEPMTKLTVQIYPQEKELFQLLSLNQFHPGFLKKAIRGKDKSYLWPMKYPYRVVPYLYSFYGFKFAQSLLWRKNVTIETIFSGILPEDGVDLACQSFTAIRSTLFGLSAISGNYKWQYAALPFEKEIGTWLGKKDLIRIGMEMNLPLDKTWTCYHGHRYHCGQCPVCLHRRESFRQAGVPDTTIYETDRLQIISKIKKIPIWFLHHLGVTK